MTREPSGVSACSSTSGASSLSRVETSPELAATKNASTTARSAPEVLSWSGAVMWTRSRARLGQHLHGRGRASEHNGDLCERDVKDVVQDERDPLSRGEGVHDDVQRQAHGFSKQEIVLR